MFTYMYYDNPAVHSLCDQLSDAILSISTATFATTCWGKESMPGLHFICVFFEFLFFICCIFYYFAYVINYLCIFLELYF